MKGLCVYIMAGKGHYVPAKAVSEHFAKIDVESSLVDFFDFLGIHWMEKINQGVWRLMLRFPFIEKHLFGSLDKSGWAIKFITNLISFLRKKKLRKIIDQMQPDFIFATHPYPGTILSTMLHNIGKDIPVYFYSTDVFSAPYVSICPYLRKFLIPTEEGAKRVIEMGQNPDSVVICPFPLQSSVAAQPRLGKAEAREKLSLKNKFTIQLNLGGEGLGSLTLLSDILKEDLPVQIVIIGGIKKEMKLRLKTITSLYTGKNANVEIRGFIDNVSEYLAASDIIVGRAGINTIVEAMYAHRPFLITELVYIVKNSAEYVEGHKVGWNATGDRVKQLAIVKDMLNHPEKLKEMETDFESIPIEYSALNLCQMIKDDVNQLSSLS